MDPEDLASAASALGRKDAAFGWKTRNAESLMKALGCSTWTREEATIAGKAYRAAHKAAQIKKARPW